MPDFTMAFPIQFADHSSLNQSFLVDAARVAIQLGEQLSILPFVDLVMIGAQSTQTIRRASVQRLGNTVPTALAGTTDEPASQDRVMGYDDITCAPFGTSAGQTFDDQMFALREVAQVNSYEQLLAETPGCADALMVDLACDAVAGISASVGSSASDMSLDTLYAAKANFNAQYPGEGMSMTPFGFFHHNAVEQAEQSARAEPGMVQNGMGLAVQTFHSSQIFENWLGTGITAIKTSRVNTSAGAYQNAIVDPGAVAIGVGNTGLIQPPAGLVQAMSIPMLGLFAFADAKSLTQRTNRLVAFFWMGASVRQSSVFRQVRLLSASS